MAVITPFRAVRYNPAKINDLAEVVSPPYDVIDANSQAALAGRNPYNMINLDLSKNVKSAEMTDQRYAKAARLFAEWRADEVLIREEQPAIYLYNVDYRVPGGASFTRRGLVSLVRLAEFSEGIVKPHEKTFSGVTGDRLRLLDACQAQLSPIFSLYSDPAGEILARLESARPAAPLYEVSDHDGCVHRFWAVTDPEALAAVQAMFADKPLYIADGHHRYTTALQYRALMRERSGGEIAADSPANQTMMYLCGMEDPGLSILPTHRLMRLPGQTTADGLTGLLAENFLVEEIKNGSRENLVGEVLGRMADGASQAAMFGFYHPGEDRCFLLALRDGVMERLAAHQPAALRELDVVVLAELILARLPSLDLARCVQGDLIDYYSDPDDALDVAVKEVETGGPHTPLLFLMNPTRVEQVRRVADEGLVMPHKSTFFYPKLLTGLALNSLA